MRKRALAAIVLAGCGRIAFDAVGGDGPDGDGPPALSCGTLAPTCGPTGTSQCCDSPVVTGGIFNRSYDGVGCDDCANLTAASNRVLRGGSFDDISMRLRAANRFLDTPSNRDYGFGVRCARSAP